jgi:1-acyl-sn-glycerol-3-phosphate acyltransferase
MLAEKGPILIAANHPNSFLDAIILASLFKEPIYSLARGDAFANRFLMKILTSLNMFPVYRTSEGVENLERNYTTFEACQHLFSKNKIVLIFSEGRCINEWHLRPLKKGTARLALDAWANHIPLKVLPLGINYNSFRKFGKIVHLNFGEFITEKDLSEGLSNGKSIQHFNSLLRDQLEDLVYEIEPGDSKTFKKIFNSTQPTWKQILLALPASIGFILNAPLYYIAYFLLKDRANDHFDSIMVALLFVFYPIYLLLITIIIFTITHNPFSFFLLLLMPLTALCLLHFWKKN